MMFQMSLTMQKFCVHKISQPGHSILDRAIQDALTTHRVGASLKPGGTRLAHTDGFRSEGQSAINDLSKAISRKSARRLRTPR